jgi:hypothetical protein
VARKLAAPIPRVALTPAEAAASLGVGPDFFDRYIRPEVEWVYRGSKRLVAVHELERWVTESGRRVPGGEA